MPNPIADLESWVRRAIDAVNAGVSGLRERVARLGRTVEDAFERAVWVALEYVWRPARRVFDDVGEGLAGFPSGVGRLGSAIVRGLERGLAVSKSISLWVWDEVIPPIRDELGRLRDYAIQTAGVAADTEERLRTLLGNFDALVVRAVAGGAHVLADVLADAAAVIVDDLWGEE